MRENCKTFAFTQRWVTPNPLLKPRKRPPKIERPNVAQRSGCARFNLQTASNGHEENIALKGRRIGAIDLWISRSLYFGGTFRTSAGGC